ncbi:MAG: GIY-YIG nuclease family protein, partial [Chitinophagaceae bacterium]
MAVSVQLRSGAQKPVFGLAFCVMNFFVYILYSARLAKFYTGTTNDVDRRLEEHNSRLYKDAFSVKG